MNIKRIIAREGLVLIGFAVIALIIFLTGTRTQIQWEQYRVSPVPNKALILWANGDLAILFFLIGYSLYLVVLFTVWAVRKLRAKK